MSIKINFECPNCHQSLRSDPDKIVSEITCPTCATKFIPVIPQPLKPECRDNLRIQARSCSFLAAVLLVAAVLVFFGKFLAGSSSDGVEPSWVNPLAGWCIILAVGVQIIAQLLHIRASLEK